ncbi:MAG TPA: hypothetical protein VMQ76_11785 [Terracidiphilus sp.]|nr:hypothetical protein [Terracidiphilus sp.]
MTPDLTPAQLALAIASNSASLAGFPHLAEGYANTLRKEMGRATVEDAADTANAPGPAPEVTSYAAAGPWVRRDDLADFQAIETPREQISALPIGGAQ